MRVLKASLVALAATFALSATADAIEVKKKREAPGKPEELWAVVGDFCAIKDWHPGIVECEEFEEDGDTYRTLTLGDGGKIKEKLTGKDDTSYSYEIIESPFPVKNYSSTLEVDEEDEEDRLEIEWEAEFDADGVEDEKAEEIIKGIFKAGVSAIKKKAIEVYDAREAAAGNPVSTGRDRSKDDELGN